MFEPPQEITRGRAVAIVVLGLALGVFVALNLSGCVDQPSSVTMCSAVTPAPIAPFEISPVRVSGGVQLTAVEWETISSYLASSHNWQRDAQTAIDACLGAP